MRYYALTVRGPAQAYVHEEEEAPPVGGGGIGNGGGGGGISSLLDISWLWLWLARSESLLGFGKLPVYLCGVQGVESRIVD